MDNKKMELENMIVCLRQTISDNNSSLNDFEIGSEINRGSFGVVFYSIEKKYNRAVAIKKMDKNKITPEKLNNEIKIQMSLKHKNIVQLLNFFSNESYIFLVLEYISGGDLFGYIQSNDGLKANQVSPIAYQLSDALNYCHSKSIIHRDVKTENVLLDGRRNVKLADFGLSAFAPLTEESGQGMALEGHLLAFRRTFCGTVNYMAPEIVKKELYSYVVDNWALGVLLYECFVGLTPFEGDDDEEVVNKIINFERVEFPPTVPAGAQAIIDNLLQVNPVKRLPLDAVMDHSWIAEQRDIKTVE